jgi:hypothetical protein
MIIANVQPEIIFLEENLTEYQSLEYEMVHIRLYGRRNNETGCLLNLTDGGEAPNGMKHTQEFIDNMKNYLWTPEAMAKASATRTGKKLTLEHRINAKVGAKKYYERPFAKCGLFSGKIEQIFLNVVDVKKYGYHPNGVRDVLKGRTKTHKNWQWRYLMEEEIKTLLKTPEDY